MRAVVQRVSEASVTVAGEIRGKITDGLLVYVGVDADDDEADVRYLADKVRHLRIFPDERQRMNRDVVQAGGQVLVVSAFTVSADARKGRRPSFDTAAPPERAEEMYERVCTTLEQRGCSVARGRFRTMMDVHSVNAGPVCILLDSRRRF
jgi:D-tyrosyl-tRNA(Tyr) deacylase